MKSGSSLFTRQSLSHRLTLIDKRQMNKRNQMTLWLRLLVLKLKLSSTTTAVSFLTQSKFHLYKELRLSKSRAPYTYSRKYILSHSLTSFREVTNIFMWARVHLYGMLVRLWFLKNFQRSVYSPGSFLFSGKKWIW